MSDSEIKTTPDQSDEEKVVSQSYWSLVWWKFRKNRMAVIGAIILAIFYITCIFFPEFFAPYSKERQTNILETSPTSIHFFDEDGNFSLRPFVYGLEKKVDLETRQRTYIEDPSQIYYIYFFVPAEEYKLLGIIPTDIHLFGTDPDTPMGMFSCLVPTDWGATCFPGFSSADGYPYSSAFSAYLSSSL